MLHTVLSDSKSQSIPPSTTYLALSSCELKMMCALILHLSSLMDAIPGLQETGCTRWIQY